MKIDSLITQIKSEGILRSGSKLQDLYELAIAVEAERDQLQEQVKALSVENVQVKAIAEVYANRADELLSDMTGNGESDHRRECYEECNKTPTTDAFVAEMKASGIDEFALAMQLPSTVTPQDAREYAAELRKQGGE